MTLVFGSMWRKVFLMTLFVSSTLGMEVIKAAIRKIASSQSDGYEEIPVTVPKQRYSLYISKSKITGPPELSRLSKLISKDARDETDRIIAGEFLEKIGLSLKQLDKEHFRYVTVLKKEDDEKITGNAADPAFKKYSLECTLSDQGKGLEFSYLPWAIKQAWEKENTGVNLNKLRYTLTKSST